MTDWYLIVRPDEAPRQVASFIGEDLTRAQTYALPRRGDLAFERFDPAVGWVDRMDELRAALLAQIDVEREQLQRAEITAGSAKALVYAQKAREVAAYQAAQGRTYSRAEIRQLYPAASAEMEISGDDLGAVMDRIAVASAAANAALFRIDALATSAKEAVRQAADGAAARAAAAVDWSA